ncbi:hypothetical protein ADL00_31815 [Streptomyces sp. AS58]|nr:hypothetical protein ADL00_31815 [Streptomyces sp. AS58]
MWDRGESETGAPRRDRATETGASPRDRASEAGASPTERGPESGVSPAVVRDPWEASAGDRLHDPHEVTVQLDAIGHRLGDPGGGGRETADGRPDGAQDGSDGPVFVDESGRRSRTFRRLGVAAGLACAVYAVVILATLLSGNSNAPWLPVPDQKGDAPASKVDSPALPAQSAPPSANGTGSPGDGPTDAAGTTPEPSSEADDPGASGTPDAAATSSDPEPTATRTTTRPRDETNVPKPPVPSVPPVTTSPDPSPTGGPSADPSPSEGGDGGTGSDTVADGPNEPGPATTVTAVSL